MKQGIVRRLLFSVISLLASPAVPHLPILYETEHLLVIDKPTGLSHHDKEDGSRGVISLLKDQQARRSPLNGATPPQLYGVHRLDFVTSGLLLVAKTPTMARQLTQAFTDRKVTKYYTGLSFKTPKKKKQGWVQGYMRRGRRKSWYLTRDAESKKEDDTDAVWAQSFFWTAGLGNVADAFYPPSNADHVAVTPSPRTLLLLRPHTGRTHQLRVAAKSVGLPLAGDPLYTTATTTTASAATSPTVPRTCLHATGLHIAAACFDNDVGLTEDLILWSPPPFLAWWRDPHYLAAKSLLRLLQKDTTVPPGLRQAAVDALGPEDKES